MENYAVFGHPIAQSLSPQLHAFFAEQTNQKMQYVAKLAQIDTFEQEIATFFAQNGLGCNITSPFKQRAFALANLHSERCLRAKSCNTLKKMPDGKLFADNTDGLGLVSDLQRLNWLKPEQKVLILGAGGATQGVIFPLLEAKQQLFIANRSIEKVQAMRKEFLALGEIQPLSIADLAHTTPFDLIINATSIGLHGAEFPFSSNIINPLTKIYDMQYGLQSDTPFLAWAKQQGAKQTADGLGMLLAQGAESFALWRGIKPDYLPLLTTLRQAK